MQSGAGEAAGGHWDENVLPKAPGKLPSFRHEKTKHKNRPTTEQALESLGGFVKTQIAGPTPSL